jgi:site-specific DNA recombinase
VQARLDEQRRGKRRSRTSSEALLLGRIFDDRGNRMTPSYAVKNGARYRYYVSCVLAQGRKHDAGSVPRLPAPEIERIVLKTLRETEESEEDLSERELVLEHLARVVVRTGRLELSLSLPTEAARSTLVGPRQPPQARDHRPTR